MDIVTWVGGGGGGGCVVIVKPKPLYLVKSGLLHDAPLTQKKFVVAASVNWRRQSTGASKPLLP